jgi:hypothetical protein
MTEKVPFELTDELEVWVAKNDVKDFFDSGIDSLLCMSGVDSFVIGPFHGSKRKKADWRDGEWPPVMMKITFTIEDKHLRGLK